MASARAEDPRRHRLPVSAHIFKICADTLQVEPSRTSPCDGMRQTAAANAKRRAIARAQRGSSARRKARCTAAPRNLPFAFLFLNSAPTMRLWRPHAAPTSSQCYQSMRFRWHDVRRRRGRQFARAVDVFSTVLRINGLVSVREPPSSVFSGCGDEFFRPKERDRRRGSGPRIPVDRKPRAREPLVRE